MKKFIAFISFILVLIITSTAAAANYPAREITGIVQLGEKGTDDFTAREITLKAEKNLGQPISIWSFSGKNDITALKYFQDSKADGYIFYTGVEYAGLSEKTNSSVINFNEFDCIYLTGEFTDGLVLFPIDENTPLKDFQNKPEKFNYVPRGFLYGVYVKKGTPDEAVKKLSEAFKQAGNEQKIKDVLEKNGVQFLGLAGREAQDYVTKWRGGNYATLLAVKEVTAMKTEPAKKNPAPKKNEPAKKSQPAKTQTPPKNQNKQARKGYPEHEITAIVQMSKGGATDVLTRAVTEKVAKILGQPINVRNIAGNSGAYGMRYAYESKADGYTLLMGSEHTTLHDKLGISPLHYDKFKCVYLIGEASAGVIVRSDSKYQTLRELLEDAKDNPRTITCGVTGVGSVGWGLCAFFKDIAGAEFDQVNHPNGGVSTKAVADGECECAMVLLQHGFKEYEKGNVKFLTVVAPEPDPLMPDVPVVTDEYPDFFKYLPWGAFYGIFVKDGTDPAIIKTLSDAYVQAGKDKDFQAVLQKEHIRVLAYTGKQADDYITNWRNNTLDGLITSGAEGLYEGEPPLPPYPADVTPPKK